MSAGHIQDYIRLHWVQGLGLSIEPDEGCGFRA